MLVHTAMWCPLTMPGLGVPEGRPSTIIVIKPSIQYNADVLLIIVYFTSTI